MSLGQPLSHTGLSNLLQWQAKQHNHIMQRAARYGDPIGIRLLTALEGIGAEVFTTAEAVSEGAGFRLSPSHVHSLLHRLAASGLITRAKRGVYAINDPVTRVPRAHPFAIGVALVTPSVVSHWSALQHWGLTEQIPSTVTLSSLSRTFPDVSLEDTSDGRPAWVVNDVSYEFIAIKPSRFFGVAPIWVNERNRIPIFDRERALLDTFHHFRIFGSLSVALEILEDHLAEIDVERLVAYAARIEIGTVAKRVGWTLELLGVPPARLEPLRAVLSKGDAPLDPGLPARGRHNPAWHVIENLAAYDVR